MNWCFDFLSGIHFLTCDLYQAHLTPVFTHILLLLLAHILPYTSLMSSLLLPQDSLKREYYANPIDKATPEEPAINALFFNPSELLRILISTLHYSASHVLILFQHPPTFSFICSVNLKYFVQVNCWNQKRTTFDRRSYRVVAIVLRSL